MPRPRLPDGLYVSVSQVKTWLMCPRKFELHYIRGLPPAFVPVNLALGSAVHEALAAYYLEIKSTGVPLRRDLVLDTFRAAWAKAEEADIPLQTDEESGDLGQVIDRGVSLLHAFHQHATAGAQPESVEAVEMGFIVDIHDPNSGEVLDEKLVGTIDVLVCEGGRAVVYEHKTSSKRFSKDQLDNDLQVTAYKLAARQLGLGEVVLKYQVLVKAKNPAVQVAEVRRDAHAEMDFLRTAVGVLKAIDAGASFPIRGWQCRTCPWAGPCGGS